MESRRFSDSCLISKPSLNPAMSCGGELRKAGYLTAVSIKIFWREPVLESNLDRRPFAIEDREPRRITVAPLVDIGLAPNALEFEAEPGRCCPRFVIERIALPSVAAIAEFIKDVPHHQVHRLGCGNPTLKWRRVNDPANLDATSGRVNIQIARLTERLPARKIDQCVFRVYAAGPNGVDSCAQFFRPGIRSPDATFDQLVVKPCTAEAGSGGANPAQFCSPRQQLGWHRAVHGISVDPRRPWDQRKL